MAFSCRTYKNNHHTTKLLWRRRGKRKKNSFIPSKIIFFLWIPIIFFFLSLDEMSFVRRSTSVVPCLMQMLLSHDCIKISGASCHESNGNTSIYGEKPKKKSEQNFPSSINKHALTFSTTWDPQRFMISFPDDVTICVENIIELSHAQTHIEWFSAPKHSITKYDSHLWPSENVKHEQKK